MARYGVKIKGIIKCENRFLIVKKWYDDRIEDPYQWEFIDADLEDGETAESQCLSTVKSTTSVDVDSISISYTWTYKLGDNNFLGIAMLCTTKDELVIMSEDLYDYKWVMADELPEYVKNKSVLSDLSKAGIISIE